MDISVEAAKVPNKVYVDYDVTDSVPARVYAGRIFLEREYYVPLDQVLCGSRAASEERLLAFVRVAADHLRGRCENARGLMPQDLL